MTCDDTIMHGARLIDLRTLGIATLLQLPELYLLFKYNYDLPQKSGFFYSRLPCEIFYV